MGAQASIARGDGTAQELYRPPETERRLSLAFITVGFAHLAVGILLGLLQGLQHAGIDLYAYVPFVRHYYQGLAMHGVFNVLVFTTFFIGGFLFFVAGYGFRRPLVTSGLAWTTFWLMTAGLLLVDWALLTNQASVLYTSYAPLQAHPAYYLGLVLVVVGTWLQLVILLRTFFAWRRENPGKRTPLIAFGALVTLIMWTMASAGIAVQFVGFLLPWSLGWMQGIDPLLSRTLFWFTGHPIVYFWLLPAYISWYFMLPRQVGGRLFSESLARLAFLLFIPLSLPVGFHHQYLDPGVSEGYKAIHAFLTFAVFMPSAMTAFTVLASIETGGRARGGQGRLGWLLRLPWRDPSVAAQLLAMVLFAFGGISGLINASFTVNLVVHNTLFVPGHFHLTVGTASALTFMGIVYWLVPYLSGRRLFSPRMGVWQAWLWFVGMTIMSRGMSWAGVLGAPRRTALGTAPYFAAEWTVPTWLTAIGGAVLTISGLLFFINLIGTLTASPRAEKLEVPVVESAPDGQDPVPGWLDRFAPWVTATAVLVLISYGPTLYRLFGEMSLTIPGLRPY
ncbi:MAG: cbb3-type cytochrome c oxidase subunit I [Firmicutes bacterium]|nr:cbb3-type cytochrome c oxidase subunit I [Bacillota bacterium]